MERDLTMDPSVTQAPSGLLPTWVDEASNPGPGDIRNARRMRSTQLDCESVEEEAIQVHRARSSADHEGRVAVPLRRTFPATTKRLRLTGRNHHRMSQTSTVPGVSQSICDAFDLSRKDSDQDIADAQHSQVTSSLVDVDRSFVVHRDNPRFEHWVGGTPSQHEGDAVHLPVDEEDTELLDGFEESTVGEEEVPHSIPDTAVEVVVPRGPALREALESLDLVDTRMFALRGAVMKTVPKFLFGPFRNALKFAMEEATTGVPDRESVRQARGWKLLLLIPRLLLHRPPGGARIPKRKLVERFEKFSRGEWHDLIRESTTCDEKAAVSRRRSRRRQVDELEMRATRAEMLVQMGESARQALEGAALAEGDRHTLNVLTDANRRPPVPRDPILPELLHHVPARSFKLDTDRLCRNLRSSRRGAAGGPSGMTTEHLRPPLHEGRSLELFSEVCSRLVQAKVPQTVVDMVRSGRLTALTKPDGGVRGIVAGDVIRRLVARTMAQQMAETVERATAPHQYALSTRAGCECVAHVLQGLTELDPETTVTSLDGIGAFDTISREAMLRGLQQADDTALPFVSMFYGSPSEYLWEDNEGTVHRIPQGEGGEQGDALMPLLFALGQHEALQAVSRQLRSNERLLAFLDDVHLTSKPDRAGACYTIFGRRAQSPCLHPHPFGEDKGVEPSRSETSCV